ncbi:hypothetical protein ACWGE0_06025 [Lentzea sp. NPDC054927]
MAAGCEASEPWSRLSPSPGKGAQLVHATCKYFSGSSRSQEPETYWESAYAAFRVWFTETIAASGLSSRELGQVIEVEVDRLLNLDDERRVLAAADSISPPRPHSHWLFFSHVPGRPKGRHFWSIDVPVHVRAWYSSVLHKAENALAGHFESLLQVLRRLVWLGRRAHSARQSATHRQLIAGLAMKAVPDSPPGDLVVSSTRVPRGPDLVRVVPPPMVETTRRKQLVLS